MVSHLCNASQKIMCTELVGPIPIGSIRSIRYFRFEHEVCGLNCLRMLKLNKIFPNSLEMWETNDKSELKQLSPAQISQWGHGDICNHEKCISTNVNFQELIANENSRRITINKKLAENDAKQLQDCKLDLTKKKHSATATIVPSTTTIIQEKPLPLINNDYVYEVKLHSCASCGINCTRARIVGMFMNGPWLAMDQL